MLTCTRRKVDYRDHTTAAQQVSVYFTFTRGLLGTELITDRTWSRGRKLFHVSYFTSTRTSTRSEDDDYSLDLERVWNFERHTADVFVQDLCNIFCVVLK